MKKIILKIQNTVFVSKEILLSKDSKRFFRLYRSLKNRLYLGNRVEVLHRSGKKTISVVKEIGCGDWDNSVLLSPIKNPTSEKWFNTSQVTKI